MNKTIITDKQQQVIACIIGERIHQDRKWGTVDERPREVGTYLTLMRKILTDAERAFAENSGDYNALDEMRKVVAVGVACFEQHHVPSRQILSLGGRMVAAESLIENIEAITNSQG